MRGATVLPLKLIVKNIPRGMLLFFIWGGGIIKGVRLCMHVCMYACMYVCVYTCVYIYIYIPIYVYVYTQ